MNKEYDNTNAGALFRAEKKTDKHPDYTGSLNVEGKEYYLSAWIKESKAGAKYMSLAVKLKTDTPAVLAKPTRIEQIDPDSDIPF